MKHKSRSKTTRSLGIVCICLCLFLITGGYYLAGTKNKGGEQAVPIYYIHNNPCESCREYLHFVQDFQSEITGEVPSEAYRMKELNLLLDGARDTYEQLMKELDIPEEDRFTPMLIIGDRYLTGSENIQKNRRKLLRSETGLTAPEPDNETNTVSQDWKAPGQAIMMPGAKLSSSDSYLLYFSTTACEACQEAKAYIEKLPESIQVKEPDGKSMASNIVVEERNITEAGNPALYQNLLEKYRVPEKDRVVPLVFFQGGYLSGKEAIQSELEGRLKDGEALGFSEIITANIDITGGLSLKDVPKVLAAGLAGGLNPCSFSMLFLLLSLIAAKKNSVLKLGGIYLLSKFIAYFLIAVSFYQIVNVLESALFESVRGFIRLLLVAAAILFALLSFLDFLKARKEQYGRMLLKLPNKIRKTDSSIMEKLMNESKKPLWVIVFLLGFIISAGEFLCSGQVYLATLLTMNHLDNKADFFSYVLILLYILVMILPSLGIVILVHRGKRLQGISAFIVGHIGTIKLINMLVFLIMGMIFLLY